MKARALSHWGGFGARLPRERRIDPQKNIEIGPPGSSEQGNALQVTLGLRSVSWLFRKRKFHGNGIRISVAIPCWWYPLTVLGHLVSLLGKLFIPCLDERTFRQSGSEATAATHHALRRVA